MQIRHAAIAALLLAGWPPGAGAQEPRPAGSPPASARASAPIDLTGYWVSVVTEDWRWRMLVPPKGDYTSVPLSPAGRRVADGWDPSKAAADGCRAFGAAAIMRVPGRLRIAWESDSILRIETDAGAQMRRLRFGPRPADSAERTWQGVSIAQWEPARGRRGRGGSLKVVTSRMRAGYLRANGVPYSENAALTEYFDRHAMFGSEWLTVTTMVDDPDYLAQPFITSSDFKREADGSSFRPTPCERP